MFETPRYLVLDSEEAHAGVVYIGNIPRRVGAEIELLSWPDLRLLLPVNDVAHRVARFWAQHRSSHAAPTSLMDPLVRRPYLPGLVGAHETTPGRVIHALPGMPKYLATHRETKFG